MAKTETAQGPWTVERAAELYGIRNWGAGYFGVSETGEVVITPRGNNEGVAISMMDIISGLKERGLDMPVLLRLEDILDSRIKLLHESFRDAIREQGYQGAYRGVYPIKVNQQEQVVERVTHYGATYHHGLEAGSKAELIAALSFVQDPESYVVCNGYKDEEFVDLGLYALKMGIRCVFVIENPGEFDVILERSRRLGVRPILGVRIKLWSKAGGHWNASGGDRSVFGLNAAEIITLTDKLREHGMLDCLHLLHYHLGSQIPNIRDIREAVMEACRIYIGLVREGAVMGALDLGGGLAVDYDGSHTDFPSSRNYTISEYCADVVEVVMGALDEVGVAHPTIITESGRATVAYYSVLLFNILDVSRFETRSLPERLPEDAHEMLFNLVDVAKQLGQRNVQECYHDAVYYRDELRQLFKHGVIGLREHALTEQIFLHLLTRISEEVKQKKYIPDEFENLGLMLSDIYYGNFSVFQSLPDAWAIDQLFPVMPVHRLTEEPTREAIVTDITCDCDGKLDRFIDLEDVKQTLRLHELKDSQEYYLGVFLVGAYQETLGDLHNLLGDTNVVSIRINDDRTIEYAREIEGDSVEDVLTYVEYEPKSMILRVREMAEKAILQGRITAQERRQIMEAYEAGMRGYTYFER